jgi:hypothetical protein
MTHCHYLKGNIKMDKIKALATVASTMSNKGDLIRKGLILGGALIGALIVGVASHKNEDQEEEETYVVVIEDVTEVEETAPEEDPAQ